MIESRPAQRGGAHATSDRVCYIHIGTHKTGTTSIQAFLARNRARFAELGVTFPYAGSVDDRDVIAHHELANELRGSSDFASARGGLAAIVQELRASAAHVACITSEDLSFLYDAPATLARLRDGLLSSGFRPRIIVYLRPQVPYCTAVYAENVRHGYREPFKTFLSQILDRGCYLWNGGSGPPFDYNRLLNVFAAVFGREALIARRYRSGAADIALLLAFARLLVPSARIETFQAASIRYNGSLSFAAVLKRLDVDCSIDETLRFTPLNLQETLHLGARFVLQNARLRWRYHVAVPVFEPLDLAFALPLRRTRAKTAALVRARRALRAGTGSS